MLSMVVYSWNMLYRNRELSEALRFIAESNFDLFCLQEVPEAFLPRLRELPYHMTSHVDTERLSALGYEKLYLVILSKHPVQKHGTIPYPDYGELNSWRTRLFVGVMPRHLFTKLRNRGGLYADISIGGNIVRVFNLHFVLAHPTWRLKEFERAMAEHNPTLPSVVCGDFNVLEKPHITPLNWLMGGSFLDALLFNRERTHIEKRFVEHSLQNPLRGTMTHGLSRSQLDHVLVSHAFVVRSAAVLRDTFGSDHHPVRVELA